MQAAVVAEHGGRQVVAEEGVADLVHPERPDEPRQLRAIGTQMKGQLDLAMIEVQKAGEEAIAHRQKARLILGGLLLLTRP